MKVVIIEDEPLMAQNMACNLQQLDPGITIGAILPSVRQANSYFAGHEIPDLVFSDIQLGDGLSFEIFRSIKGHVPVVFCTAYDEYALDAFKANGIDYILKPFTNTCLYNTLQKYRHLQAQFFRQQQTYDKLIELTSRKRNVLLVFQNERIIPLPVSEIALLYIKNKTTIALCFDQQAYMISQPLDELEDICGNSFYRANRQYLVNRKAIKEAYHYYARKLLVRLSVQFRDTIKVSKDKYSDFLQWLSD
jgi:two-component system response regulator LytT